MLDKKVDHTADTDLLIVGEAREPFREFVDAFDFKGHETIMPSIALFYKGYYRR
jgi:hypothetical protein